MPLPQQLQQDLEHKQPVALHIDMLIVNQELKAQELSAPRTLQGHEHLLYPSDIQLSALLSTFPKAYSQELQLDH